METTPVKEEPKPSKDSRREETDRAFAAIMEEERRARIEKSMRLKSMRLLRQ